MRIRSIKPEFWRSDDITSLPVEDRLLFIGLWSYVDDNGVGRDEDHLILADLFSRDHFENPRETLARVQRGLARLSEGGLIARYRVDGKPYLYVSAWTAHQRVDKPNKPRYPAPDQADRYSPEGLATSSREPREIPAPGTEEQGAGEQGNRGTEEQAASQAKRATRIPDPFVVTAEMRAWAAEEVPGIDVDTVTRMFVDHWRAESGTKATKLDWVATWRNWLRREPKHRPGRPAVRESSIDRQRRQAQQMLADLAGGGNGSHLRAIGDAS